MDRLLDEACAAHERHDDGRCLEMLDRVGSVSVAAARDPATLKLRRAAEAAQRARAAAEAARERPRRARAAAQQADGPRHAAAGWAEAEARAFEADRALDLRRRVELLSGRWPA